MKSRTAKFCLITLTVLLTGIFTHADDGCARRYASVETNPIVCKYYLLSKRQIQKHLQLTKEQDKPLKLAMVGPTTSIPEFVEFRHLQKELLAKALTEEAKVKIRREGNQKASMILQQHWETVMQATLAPAQRTNLDALFLQMKGPSILLEDTSLVLKLRLPDQELELLKRTSDSYDPILRLLRHRYLELQIQPSRSRTGDDVSSEMKCLVRVITEIEKDQDSELLSILSITERKAWTNMCGKVISVDWVQEYFSTFPFDRK